MTGSATLEHGNRPGRAPPAPSERIVPANTERSLPSDGSAPPPAGGHAEDAHPWPWLAVEALLEGMGEVVPRLLATLWATLARLLGS